MTTQPNKQKSPRHSNKKNPNKVDNRLRMLIDASKLEETRVAVVQRGRLEDFEVESLVRRQIKGNIYLAKVTRVEPSLQAAFVNYGGNRHGFLPFSEIHPDYYRIPVADRERLMAEQAELERNAIEEAARIAEEEDRKAAEEVETEDNTTESHDNSNDDNITEIEDDEEVIEAGADADAQASDDAEDDKKPAKRNRRYKKSAKSDDKITADSEAEAEETTAESDTDNNADTDADVESDASSDDAQTETDGDNANNRQNNRRGGRGRYRRGGRTSGGNNDRRYSETRATQDRVVDDEEEEELNVEPFWKRIRRAYKIQEVIKRGQIVLIQVGKEERGNKGAAVTTYITLPGRYCVLMPNTPQSGGVSRKISNFKDRKRMRDILKELNVPDGMSVILRTAGTSRTPEEIKRDLDYLMRLWNNARDLTLNSTAPALINEEGSLIRRAIRDIYNKDIDEVIVAGDAGYKTAFEMMKMLMPSHAQKVVQYKAKTPLFIAENLERQIEDMHSPQVELKSGGYLVINPTEALVSIDVNSGRSTKERNIDDTALRTNMEAAEEIARQLKLRDLGGLVVIDFIDMENRRFNGKVERAMHDALANDRARIQIGRISSFGLMEMSRQRLHPSLTETHFQPCPHCHGMGIVKTVDTMALTILRAIEECAMQQGDSMITVTMSNDAALYLFNHHRHAITDLESRYNSILEIAVGHVEEERGYMIESKRKQKEDMDEDQSAVDMMDTGADSIVDALPTIDTNPDDTKPTKGKSRRGGRKRTKVKTDGDDATQNAAPSDEPKAKADSAATDAPSDIKMDDQIDDKSAQKPAKPRQTAAKKKIEIADGSEKSVTEAQSSPEIPATDNTQATAKPAKGKAASKKSTKVDAAPATKTIPPTNDNAGAGSTTKADENIAARASETVNAEPKSKKKGWWNKITS